MKKILALLMALVPACAAAQTSDWQKSWDETVAAARKEGRVVMSGPPNQEMRQALPAAFYKRFGITLEYIGNRGAEMAAKLRAERQAGIYLMDVVVAGIQTIATILYPEKMLDPLKPQLVLPEVVDGSKWKRGSLWFADPEQQHVLRLTNNMSALFHINTSVVRPEEIQSSSDLLDPKWKGKIAFQDPTFNGSGSNDTAKLYVQFGEEFIKRLYIDQKPAFSRDTRQLTDWLARGTYPIAWNAEEPQVEQMRKDNIPLMAVYRLSDMPPSTSGGFGQVVLLNRAPHPNAARVLVNWLASKEGLEVYARARREAPTRNDIDESFLPPDSLPRAGEAYFDTYDWDFTVNKKEPIRLRMKELLQAR
jgi:ABC-type Fe3+ transport system substrate-binding protein